MGKAPPSQVRPLEVQARDLSVPPARIRPSGGGPLAALAATVGLTAVIAAGVVAASLAPPEALAPPAHPAAPTRPVPSAATPGPATPAPAVAVANPAVLAAIPPRLTAPQLSQAVRDGTLEGHLVFIDGILTARPAPCVGTHGPADGCVTLAVKGLGLPVRAGPEEVPWRGDPPPGSWLVAVARGDGLEYLGSLHPSPDGAIPIELLTSRLQARQLDQPSRTMYEIRGWLVNAIRSCSAGGHPTGGHPTGGRDATLCPASAPFVSDSEPVPIPNPASAHGVAVEVAASVVDVDSTATATSGTFLVKLPAGERCARDPRARGCPGSGGRWLVLARYEPAHAIRVIVP